MLIGIPKEIKNHEYRCAATPSGVRELVSSGHKVLIQSQAGEAIDFSDEHYKSAGAKISESAEEIFEKCDLIMKVKEPQEKEVAMLRKNQVLFSYLHLSAEPHLTESLLKTGCSAIAFETVSASDGSLPLLAPMSEVAGKLSIQAGAKALEKSQGGRGVLLGGVPGVAPAKVIILGGGVAGTNAAKVAIGMGANVVVLEKSLPRLRYLSDIFGSNLTVLYATTENIESQVLEADLVIGAVLIPGAAAPKLVSKKLIKKMKKGAVLVDIAIDQGGCFETSRPTTHSQPTYEIEGVIHYCVTNMPGAVARTSTQALENSTLPFTLAIANQGMNKALRGNKYLLTGLNVFDGKVTCQPVAESLGHKFYNPESLL